MNETPPVQRERTSLLLPILLGLAALLTVVLLIAGFVWLKSRKLPAHTAEATPLAAVGEATVPEPPALRPTNVVNIRLGEDESGHGLILVKERDGHSEIESIDGVSARVVRLAAERKEQYLYFRIDDAF